MHDKPSFNKVSPELLTRVKLHEKMLYETMPFSECGPTKLLHIWNINTGKHWETLGTSQYANNHIGSVILDLIMYIYNNSE